MKRVIFKIQMLITRDHNKVHRCLFQDHNKMDFHLFFVSTKNKKIFKGQFKHLEMLTYLMDWVV